MMDRRQWIQGTGLLGIAGCLLGCRATPVTGRRQWMLLSENQEATLAAEVFEEYLKSETASQNLPLVQLVTRVGQNIAGQAQRPELDWEFRLIENQEQNVFCLPGGKVAVCEGILPVCENEAGLAVVMSHEMAHTLARHGGERMAQTALRRSPHEILGRLTGNRDPDQQRLRRAYAMASHDNEILPYNRQQELEADQLAVQLMAQAGYDPNEAPRFWNRFRNLEGATTSDFLVAHPCDGRRQLDLLALMAPAEQKYQAATRKLGRGQIIVADAITYDHSVM